MKDVLKEIHSVISKTPIWLFGFGLVFLLFVFLFPSWLPVPDPSLKLENIFFISNTDSAVKTNRKEQVQLPHDWRKNDNHLDSGWYQIPLTINEPMDQSLVLFITHVQEIADIWIDQIPVKSSYSENIVSGHIWSRPLFIGLPDSVLTPGDHLIEIYLHSAPSANGLLGEIYCGPAHLMQSAWEWRYHYRFTLVAVITLGMLFLSLFMGVLWILRRQDSMYGWFTACTFFWSLHNIPHFIDPPHGFSIMLWDGLYFSSLGWMLIALFIFNHRYVGKVYPKREKYLMFYALFGSLPLFILPQEWAHKYAYMVWDLSLVLIGMYAILFLLYTHSKKPIIEIKLLLIAGIIILTFGLNDFLVLSGLIDRTRGLLIQYSGLPAMLVLIWFLLSRFINVLKESESLNLELEQRINIKEIELKENYERLKKMEQERLLSEERDRIMQDVHDGVGGQLVAMLAEIETGNVSQTDMRDALTQSLTDLRLVIDSLDTASEDLPTLLGMLRSRLQPGLDGHGIKLHWGVKPLPVLEDFGPRKALHLMRILQEAISNVLKHSNAENLYVTTNTNNDLDGIHEILINIRDDGCWCEQSEQTSRGLKNMKKRANGINAKLDISGSDQGTCVEITLSGYERKNGTGTNKPDF
jgi:signal transduction histidine kinase